MDAVWLVRAVRHALTQVCGVPDVIIQAGQAFALAEAVGSHLAEHGPAPARAAASALSESGGSAYRALSPSGPHDQEPRASSLTQLPDPAAGVKTLLDLLLEVGAALVAMTCAVEEEPAYWRCADALDLVDEVKERAADLLGLLGAQEGAPAFDDAAMAEPAPGESRCDQSPQVFGGKPGTRLPPPNLADPKMPLSAADSPAVDGGDRIATRADAMGAGGRRLPGHVGSQPRGAEA